MSEKLIPEATQVAAKRGFIRTGAQSLATSAGLGGGLTLVFTGDALLALAVAVGSMLFAAVTNGLQSYFSIIGKGVPEEYVAAGVDV